MYKLEKTLVIMSISLICIASLLFANTFLKPQFKQINDNNSKNFDIVLNVKAFDSNGVLKGEFCKDNDLPTRNWAIFWAGILRDTTSNYSPTFYRYDGSPVAMVIRYSEIGSFFEGITDGQGEGGVIAIGTDNTAPTSSDNTLGSMQETYTPIDDPVYANGNVTFTGTIDITGTYTVNEVGYYETSDNNWEYLFFRDVLDSGISVVSGDTVSVTYTIVLDSSFTDNFGRLLAGVLNNIDNEEATQTIWLIDENNNNNTYNVKSGQTVEPTVWVFDTGLTSPVSSLRIGTGTTGTSRTDFNMETQVESDGSAYNPVQIANNVSITANFHLTDDRNISEVGMFLQMRDTVGTSRNIMLWRDTFSAESFSSGDLVAVTFKLYN